MVTLAEADFDESAAEVAVTVKPPAADPAVNKPLLETVPPVAVHVTAVLELPVTVAVNCCVCPGCRVAPVGETLICAPVALTMTIVSFGRSLWLAAVLAGLTISPGLLLTNMMPWFV